MPRSRRPRSTTTPRRLPARVAAEQVPPPSVLSGLVKSLLSARNVIGVFVGRKVRRGEEGGLALCCLVSQKLPRRQLPESLLIPPRLEWFPTSRRRREVRTDVLDAGSFQRQGGELTLGPGDLVRTPGRGTVGMVMDHPGFGRVVVSAGHVFTDPSWTGTHVHAPGTEPTVSMRNIGGASRGFQGALLKVVVTEDADYALVRPRGVQYCQNTFQDALPLGLPYLPTADDLGKDLYVLSHAGMRATRFVGAQGQVVVGSQGIIRNVLLTQGVTEPGDSGACLIGMDRRIWGLLVGRNKGQHNDLSVFMQVGVPLYLEGGTCV
ncbi:hypothetical protein [Pyxidicoccus xibeiensis]|uniref:hypothetical protein n=1 Tax=Pyxidicoccus xibeiensis TaxID=2906759 RepID=UPI0020A7508E|nr:hypothetical protein [Pyxidicoccus xibeiensis]MCP3137300.1 hypothetical protein [Pyxidicoccus xibeiensis]